MARLRHVVRRFHFWFLLVAAAVFAHAGAPVSAQTWEELSEQSVVMHGAGNPDSALVLAELALIKATATSGLADTVVASLLFNHGAIAWAAGRNEVAETTLVAALSIWVNTPPTEDQISDVVNLLTILGRVYYGLGKTAESIEAFQAAVQLAGKARNYPNEGLAGLYWELSQALQSQPDFELFDGALSASAYYYEVNEGMSARTIQALFRLASARGLAGAYDSCYATMNRILPHLMEAADTLSIDPLATIFEIVNLVDPLLYEGRTDLRPTSMALLEVVIRGAAAKQPPFQPTLVQARVILGGYREAEGDLELAESNLLAALADYAGLNDSSYRMHEIVAVSVLGATLVKLGKDDQADSLLSVTYQRYQGIITVNTTLTAMILGKMAELHNRFERFEDAIRVRQEMERILEPDPDPYIQNELLGVFSSQAGSYLRLEEFEQARDYSTKAIELGHKLQEVQQLTRHDDYLDALGVLGALELSRGWPGALAAENIHREAMTHVALVYGTDHLYYARELSRLAADQVVFARDISGDFDEAEQNLLQALQIVLSVSPVDHERAFMIRLPLTMLLIETGRLAEADAVAREMLQDAEAAYGVEDGLFYAALDQIAELKIRFGQNEEALGLFQRVYDAILSQRGANDPQTVAACKKLGEHYLRMSRLSEAKKYLLEAYNAANRIKNPDVLISVMVPLVDVFMAAGHYATADSGCQRIIRHERSGFAYNATVLQSSIWKMGIARWHLGELDTALALANEAISIESTNDRASYLNLAGKYQQVGRLYYEKGMLDSALACYDRSWRQAHEQYSENWTVLSEPAAIKFVEEFRRLSAGYLTFLSTLGLDERTIPIAAEVILADKGIVSDGVMERTRRLVRDADPTATAVIAQIKETSQLRSRVYVSGSGNGAMGTSLQSLDSLDTEIQRLEAELARLSSASLRNIGMHNVTPASVVAVLPNKSTLVDFIRVDHRDPFNDSLVSRYFVNVMRPGAEPKVVDLGDAAGIDDAVASYRRHMEKVSSSGYSLVPIDTLAHQKRSFAIYERVWKPILPYLGDPEVVIVSPDGALNVVAFTTLQDSAGTYLIENFGLHYLPAGRDLLRMKEPAVKGHGLFAAGDPDYNAPVEARHSRPSGIITADAIEAGSNGKRNIRSACGSLATLAVDPLPATAREVQRLVECWRSRQPDSVLAFFGPHASEDNVKKHAPGKEVVHIATHGFYLEGLCGVSSDGSMLQDDTLVYRENPLLRSGLLLAGANLHGTDAGSFADDGILTADEVVHMDLKGTRLVVLSACETGLGDIKPGEGVYGLRRSFLLAGAGTVISSLWSVPDEQTAEMMTRLYSSGDQPLVSRLREAQMAQLNAIRESGGINHPYSWGAFVAIGDWR